MPIPRRPGETGWNAEGRAQSTRAASVLARHLAIHVRPANGAPIEWRPEGDGWKHALLPSCNRESTAAE